MTTNNSTNERLGPRAAAFGQQIADLEDAHDKAYERIVELERRNKLLEGEIDRLKEQLSNALRDKDYFQRHWYETKAKLKSSASIILDAMRDEDSQGLDQYRPSTVGMRAVEKALATKAALEEDGQDQPQLPGFLTAGPKLAG